eukprot:TRINITY_DN47442_c0_g1_i1.p1 TRINITY_DN47442_c0_g1~~TRINITY_DN47442_c0_g1_i1.p1  ORF type:complete len:252 (+),score=30.24 TRINITY_DN47442_c0_g1_i1:61-816(+)
MLTRLRFTGMLKAGKTTCSQGAIAYPDSSSAQVVLQTSSDNMSASPKERHLVNYSQKVLRVRSDPDLVNKRGVHLTATRSDHAVSRDRPRWLPLDEVFASIKANREQQSLPVQPAHAPKRTGKFVQLLDDADIEEYSYTPAEQCDLGSPNELRLNMFLNRIESASNYSHEFNEVGARDIALRLREDIELQNQENEASGNFEVKAESDDEVVQEESNHRKKRVKKCFWILDAGCTPQHKSYHSVGKRWQYPM